MLCSDGGVRKCFPIICAWTADYFENVNLHSIKSGLYHAYEAPKSSFESTISSPTPLTDYPEYFRKLIEATHTMYSQRRQDEALQYLNKRGARTTEGDFWTLRCFDSTSTLVPDLLHTIYLGLLKHLMDWLVPFLAHHKRLAVFNRLWSTIGPYPGFSLFRKPYTMVTQWQGKELKMHGRMILPILGASLLEPSAELRGLFIEAIFGVKGFIFFQLVVKYRSHTD